jgi:hypothetical protein
MIRTLLAGLITALTLTVAAPSVTQAAPSCPPKAVTYARAAYRHPGHYYHRWYSHRYHGSWGRPGHRWR